MTEKLSSEDKVSLVAYAGSAGLVLPATPGSDKKRFLKLSTGCLLAEVPLEVPEFSWLIK